MISILQAIHLIMQISSNKISRYKAASHVISSILLSGSTGTQKCRQRFKVQIEIRHSFVFISAYEENFLIVLIVMTILIQTKLWNYYSRFHYCKHYIAHYLRLKQNMG